MRPSAPFLTSTRLADLKGVTHGFFTRAGGVSEGVYASLNGGVGSRDVPDAVAENRARMALALGIERDRLLVPYQIHSPTALIVDRPWADDARPRCDALVTSTPGLALGVTGADCGMILFCDPRARVIGAAHAGWAGAFGGVLEATLTAMEKMGAQRGRIVAALGPTIGPKSYEVGPEFKARFIESAARNEGFFEPSGKAGHAYFNLPGFIGDRLTALGIASFENLGLDTYADAEHFYSYRRSVHRAEPDYGRLVSAIALRA